MKLTANDQRVLDAVDHACSEWDGFIPHGPADWTAIRRLRGMGLVEPGELAICQTCHGTHEATLWTKVAPEPDRG